jgi:hypothetical protein
MTRSAVSVSSFWRYFTPASAAAVSMIGVKQSVS